MDKKKKKVVWFSRHAMTAEQAEGLERMLGPVAIETVNLVWQATADEVSDREKNAENLYIWFAKGYEVAGVFPPVAIEALNYLREEWEGYRLFTPVSRQTVEERSDGDRRIKFNHVRWAVIGGGK